MNKAEKTRQFIVEKTAPIFNMKGYAGTSLSDMTEATGLTKGSIYGNFANKDEVALAAFDFNINKVTNILKAEISKHSSVIDQLLAYAHVYEHFLQYPFPAGGCPLLNTAIDADDTHPQLKKKVAEAITRWKESLVKMIEKGKDSKELRADVNAEQIAITIIAMIEGGIMVAQATGKINYRKAVMQSTAALINSLK